MIFTPTKNHRKPEDFLMFSDSKKLEHWAKIIKLKFNLLVLNIQK